MAASSPTFASAPRFKLTAELVSRMVEIGAIAEDAPLELLNGELIVVSPQGPFHTTICDHIADLLREALPEEWVLREDKPIRSAASLPEPDLAVVPGPRSRWRSAHPAGSDCALVVEVALTSQDIDHDKAAIYAAAGVPVYWLIDLRERHLEVHEVPSEAGYGRVTILSEAMDVEVPVCGARWKVQALFL
jgi:Uma2 family endonuclease